MGITRMDTTIRTGIHFTDHIGITGTIGRTIGTAGVAITTATIGITTTIGNQADLEPTNPDRAGSRAISSQFFFEEPSRLRVNREDDYYFFDLGGSTDFVGEPLAGWSIWNSLFNC